MKHYLRSLAVVALAATTLSAAAHNRQAMMIGYSEVNKIDNFQEEAAAKFFVDKNPDGVIIAPGETAKIDASKVDVIWIHIDRLAIGLGNLPAEFSDEATIAALKKFVADGGNLYLSKQATQLVHKIGRIDAAFAPGIYGDGDGGQGTDNWTINAEVGYDNIENDPTQYYDRRNHPIYAGLETNLDFGHETFPMEGTGDGTAMHREDHNCMWDLNAYNNVYTAEGRNTVEKFEAQNNCVVIGQWGHVKDYAVAGVVEFLPQASRADEKAGKGTIIANGLAACEWAPRTGGNAFHSNLEKLTENTLAYLSGEPDETPEDPNPGTPDDPNPGNPDDPNVGVENVAAADNAVVRYFTLQGVEVVADEMPAGIYIKRQGNKATKVVVR